MTARYRDYDISPTDPVPPIPGWQRFAWCFTHKDYDGPEDDRFGYAESIEACMAEIDEREDDGSLAGWRIVDENAPRDGTHILACDVRQSFGWLNGKPLPPVQTVVHWFPDPEEPGFYTSVNETEPQRAFPATHWKLLDAPASTS